MGDQPVTMVEFHGLIAAAKALADQMAALYNTTTARTAALTAKIDNINNNNRNNINNQNRDVNQLGFHVVERIELLTPMLSIDSLLFDSDNATKSQVNDITVHDQNNKNNNSTDSIPSSDENAFVENKKDANLSHMANVHIPMHVPWHYNVPPCMYNLQNPSQQMPSCQAYRSYLQNNMHWTSNIGVNKKLRATKKIRFGINDWI
uniref:Uncharacterized protein n=1 Tax=Medicago truncatula TaxID=3880 RepID=A2Q2R6_MEDTR|nr:hypothetical protein MtrDRAFT_AC151524g41v2 [Medicago truncatula]